LPFHFELQQKSSTPENTLRSRNAPDGESDWLRRAFSERWLLVGPATEGHHHRSAPTFATGNADVRKILITGSEGLVGSALSAELRARGLAVAGLDLKLPAGHPGRADIADGGRVEQLVDGCCGIVHLAAISRVVWAEREPARCWRTNVEATRSLLRSAHASPSKPWVLFASSREVYGEPARLPVAEDAALRPVNIYGRSKAAGEDLVLAARKDGLTTAIVRFSNVYGSTEDHPDRVVPAFARGAVEGSDLRVDGSGSTFDFTHLVDAVAGVLAIIDAMEHGEQRLPPIHFCTGRATTLGELARIANRAGGQRSRIVEKPQRSYDVTRFVGDPRRARAVLGWRASVDIVEGVRRLAHDFARLQPCLDSAANPGEAPTSDAARAVAWPM
jgi:UDP-glucose 4-epimerase